MVDVQQRTLRPFKHDRLSVANRVIQQDGGVGYIWSNLVGIAGVLFINLRWIERFCAKERMRDLVLFMASVRDVRAQKRWVEQIDHA